MPDVLQVGSRLRLEERGASRIKPGLERLSAALDKLGNPQRHFSSILVVGTNGKGSTSVMVESILRSHGAKTGLFTSPHLVRVEERIRMPSLDKGDEERLVRDCLARVEQLSELTYFEAVTVAALLAFKEAAVDCAVLEAGMGGSWDATRIAASTIAGLTNVGTDHQHWLGHDRRQIAADKGAALAAAERAVLGPGVDPALIDAAGAPEAVRAAQLISAHHDDGRGAPVVSLGGTSLTLEPPFAGRHQKDNLMLALALAQCASEEGWISPLEAELVTAALARLEWPGRFSEHTIGGRLVTLDCAHNLEAATALADHLASLDRRYNLLFSCLEDKPLDAMAKVLRPVVAHVAVCPLDDPRAMPLERLERAFPEAISAPSPEQALAALADPILAAGSIRLVGSLLASEQDS